MKIYLVCKFDGEVLDVVKGKDPKQVYDDFVGTNNGEMIVILNNDNIKDIITLALRK